MNELKYHWDAEHTPKQPPIQHWQPKLGVGSQPQHSQPTVLQRSPMQSKWVTRSSTSVSRASSQDSFSRAAETEPRAISFSSFSPALGTATAQRALAREAILKAAAAVETVLLVSQQFRTVNPSRLSLKANAISSDS